MQKNVSILVQKENDVTFSKVTKKSEKFARNFYSMAFQNKKELLSYFDKILKNEIIKSMFQHLKLIIAQQSVSNALIVTLIQF